MAANPVPLGAALEYVRALFGGDVVENETYPVIGNAVTDVILGAGDRVGVVIVNQGTQNLFIAVTSAVSSTQGILLSANGGSVTMDCIRDFTLPTRNWKGISPGGNTNVYVLEVIRVNRSTGGKVQPGIGLA